MDVGLDFLLSAYWFWLGDFYFYFFFLGEFNRITLLPRVNSSEGPCACQRCPDWLWDDIWTQTLVLLSLFLRGPRTVLFLPFYPKTGCRDVQTAALCHSLSPSLPGQGTAQCFSRGCLSKSVLCSVFMLEKERSKHVLGVENGDGVIRDLLLFRVACACPYLGEMLLLSSPHPGAADSSESSCSLPRPSKVRAAFEGKRLNLICDEHVCRDPKPGPCWVITRPCPAWCPVSHCSAGNVRA